LSVPTLPVVLATIFLLVAGGRVVQGQTAWYQFENNLNDSSGNEYSGIVAGGAPTYVAGRSGYGQAIHITSADSVRWTGMPTSAAISVSFWVKLDPNSPIEAPWLLDQMASGWSGWQFKPEKLSASTAQVRWILADNNSARQTTFGPANTLYNGAWHHIVGTHDGTGTASVYFDGVLAAQTSNRTFKPATAGTPMQLNNLVQGGISQGEVDDITLWDRALTASEVTSLFYDNSILHLRITPGNQSATALEGYASPSPTLQPFAVTNTDALSAHTISLSKVDANGNPTTYSWLTLGTSQLVLAAGAGATVTATINHLSPTVLAPGIYTGYLKFSDDAAPAKTLIRQIRLTVLGCQMAVPPASYERYYTFGVGAQVFPASFTVTNTGKHGLTYTVQEVVDRTWLTLNKSGGGPLNYLATDTVTATINATNLPTGNYTCDIRFVNNCSPAGQIVVQVNLNVETNSNIPFVISYYDNPFSSVPVNSVGYSNLAACGINVVNGRAGSIKPEEVTQDVSPELAQQFGLKAMPNWDPSSTIEIPYDPAFIDLRAGQLATNYGAHPATLGYRLRDEPSANEWPAIGLLSQKLRQYDSDCIPWCNILPNYSYGSYGTGITSHKQYLDSYMSIAVPRVLCYDDYVAAYNYHYPPNPSDPWPHGDDLYWHFSNLKRFRQYSQTYGIPFWRIIESNLQNWSPNTDGIYRFQIYSSLAYGCRGIIYFTYTSQGNDYALSYGRNQVGAWGTPMPNYAIARTVNREVMTLAPILMGVSSWSVHHAGTVPTRPSTANVPTEDRETFSGLDGFYVDAITGGNCIVGNFVTPGYRTYLMFVNENYISNRTFTVTLDATHVAGLGRVDKTTGKLVLAYVRPSANYTMSLPLTAGNGELFKVLLDTNAPAVPGNLQGTAQGPTAVKLTWNASSDAESGIDHYCIYRDNVEVGTSASFSFTNSGLLPATGYSFKVAAVNGEGLESLQSPAVSVSTAAVERPTISSIVVTNGVVTVTWSSVIGARYDLLKTPDLANPAWTSVGGPLTATTAQSSAGEPRGFGSMFYRVQVVQ
jgi:chitodextrinase